ncbi:hypothetical protein Kpol_1043p9 [Vanderwaltozyma polyspora DSM 70294]|uniref:Signal recognition particle subunit SRP14 n=1 Tax=Vanderwaltozyma polyspora (strain ATCC 22028 / DSM 70294 / BCRC 21397 / CBS 2163 / NBRC 10782 / NRRL Y-8283 / UCD 57-17) TaxID=436907 RepID=A7TIM7_VANPO|nr:uncharacterized protein Kpol_1043p9 [Vanderwaltozyma polyspora DSM 70294]EDO17819.1 hypothetical protein Kpol_1043p9 [Vanderwaltozyma polyspora DSM 70294]
MSNAGVLSTQEFLVKLGEFFKIANEKHISVRMNVKRLVSYDPVEPATEHDSLNKPHYDVSKKAQTVTIDNEEISDKSYSILIRASYGSHKDKVKCSTVVSPDDLDKFWQEYSSVVRSNMNGLIKKKKKKASKGKKVTKN